MLSHPPPLSMVTGIEHDLFSRLNDITALTNEILSDKGDTEEDEE